MKLRESKTAANLKKAFAGESQSNRRYLYFADQADADGDPEVAQLFREVAAGETGHAFGHLKFLQEVGDPVTGMPIGSVNQDLRAAVAGETNEYSETYLDYAKTAREEGFDQIADWFETVAHEEKSHAARFTRSAENLR